MSTEIDEYLAQPNYATIPPRLDNLPTDVLLQIFVLVDPIDLLSIRASCKQLANITLERNLWLMVFKAICKRQRVIRGSFPTLDWSVSDLESASLRPSVFTRRIMKAKLEIAPSIFHHVDPESLSTFRYPEDPEDDTPTLKGFTEVFLAEGGRFLVTIYKARVISLWDLGVYPNTAPHAPIVSFQPHDVSSDDMGWRVYTGSQYSASNEETFRVCFSVVLSDDQARDWSFDAYFYEFQPLSSTPYKLINKFRVDGTVMAFDGRRIALEVKDTHDHEIILWDIGSGSSHPIYVHGKVKIALRGDLVIIFYLWDGIIGFVDVPSATFSEVGGLGGQWECSMGDLIGKHDYDYFKLSSPPGDYHPFGLSTFEDWIPTGMSHRCSMRIDTSLWETTDEGDRIIRFRHLASLDIPSGDAADTALIYSIGDVALLFYYDASEEREKLLCHALDLSEVETATPQPCKGGSAAIVETKLQIRTFRFCPVSARLAVLTEGQVWLMEYCPLT